MKEKLKNHTREIQDIMFLAQSSFKILSYLYLEADDVENDIIENSQFLKFSREIHWRIYVIELSKLFADRKSEHFNLYAFIQKFKKGMEYEIKEIDERSIELWELNLKMEKPNIDNLILQRDKLYGHTDRDRTSVKNTLTFKHAKELIEVVQRIVSEIYIAVFQLATTFDVIGEPLSDIKKIVASLANEKANMLNDYKTYAESLGIDPTELGL